MEARYQTKERKDSIKYGEEEDRQVGMDSFLQGVVIKPLLFALGRIQRVKESIIYRIGHN